MMSYLDLNFDVTRIGNNNRFVHGKNITLINLGPNASLSKYTLTTSTGERLEETSHAHNFLNI